MTSAGSARNGAAPAAGLRDAAQARAAQMAERVRGYVEHETPTGDAEALNAFADRLLARYADLGGVARRVPSPTGDHVAADFPGHPDRAGEAPLLFIGHHDTVWPKGHLAGPMPWRVEESAEHGTLAHGPGVFDMKSGLVVMETALELATLAALPHRPVRIVVVADEEIGSPTSNGLVRERVEGAFAALGFESPHPDGALKRGRRGSTRLRLSVRGRAAHAALDPEKGISAIDELVDQLVAVREIIARHSSGVLCNVGVLTGGGKANVVPDRASADIGLRFADAAVERAVLAELGARTPVRAGAQVSTEILSSRPTWVFEGAGDPFTSAVRRAGERLGQDIAAAPAAGAADTNTAGSLGVPTLDGFGPRGAGAHALHECIVLSSLPERAALVAGILAEV
ncbi:M20/M25/M40 family metallo-hydrolase [Streptosporangium soli]|nr:M20/M25/M40 family metallo-hydrolase [Streptosporangium sp. KLBMP 9127]